MGKLKDKLVANMEERARARLDAQDAAERERDEFLELIKDIYDDLVELRHLDCYSRQGGGRLVIRTLMPVDESGHTIFRGLRVEVGSASADVRPSDTPGHVQASGHLASQVGEPLDNTQFRLIRAKDLGDAMYEWLRQFDMALGSTKGGDARAEAGVSELPEHS